jgi:hypothetical protein
MQSAISTDPTGAKEFAGHTLTRPWKHTSPEAHSVQVAESRVNLKPGLHVQALKSLEPTDEVKFSGQATTSSSFPPGQYDPALQIGHGLVPALEPLPKYPGAQRHWFCVVERAWLRLLVGQSFFAPAMHQKLSGHDEQRSPSRKYAVSHIHGHDDTEPMP